MSNMELINLHFFGRKKYLMRFLWYHVFIKNNVVDYYLLFGKISKFEWLYLKNVALYLWIYAIYANATKIIKKHQFWLITSVYFIITINLFSSCW
jgi:hypothetical protein